ncbi:DUF1385 domain-containing protein [Stomatohabitans albus]|uniref:DUF1385 domain-containing protein n=1 Tax=Stomatohabitans albus TaxID=3110766 RepID=UPI00300C4F28
MSADPHNPGRSTGGVSYGGQAVIEGIMMRGQRTWAVAVRRPDGAIQVERHPVHPAAQTHSWLRWPLIRGSWALIDSLRTGMKALSISTEIADDDEELSNTEMIVTTVISVALFIGVFIVLPNLGMSLIADRLGGGDSIQFHLVEGVVRLVMFLVYLWGIGHIGDIKRTFQYHGAEHQTIAAFEHGDGLDPAKIAPYSPRHPRCGTNFLLLVILLSIVVYTLAGVIVPAPDAANKTIFIGYQVGLRILLLPLIAGLAYEVLKAGAHNPLLAWMAIPGLWLQYLTTATPEDDMFEVAIRAFQAVAATDIQDQRDVAHLTSPVFWSADETTETGIGPSFGPMSVAERQWVPQDTPSPD